MPDTASVEAYLASLHDAPRAALEEIRKAIRAAAPDAEETIAYGMPAYRLDGRFLLSFAAYRRHCSLFPASGSVREACGSALTPYLSGKATIRFRADDPIPPALLRRVVAARLAEIRSAGPG